MSNQLKPTFINQLPATRQERKAFVAGIKEMLSEGKENPLKFAIARKRFEELLNDLKEDKDIKDLILSEANKYGEKKFEAFGADCSVQYAGVKYDYTVCEDPEWNLLNGRLKAIQESMKQREAFLKMLKNDFTYINEETGECITIHPPVRTGTETVAITLK